MVSIAQKSIHLPADASPDAGARPVVSGRCKAGAKRSERRGPGSGAGKTTVVVGRLQANRAADVQGRNGGLGVEPVGGAVVQLRACACLSEPCTDYLHKPVMVAEVLAAIDPRAGGRYVDGTVGGGGHAAAILEASAPDGRLLGIDADPAALAAAGSRLAPFGERISLVHGNVRDLAQLARPAGFTTIDGLLLDL